MAAAGSTLQAQCPFASSSRAARPGLRRASRLHVKAAVPLWTPGGQEQPAGTRPKGWDRPWIQANSQPILAPRTADMQGDPFGLLLRQRIVFLGGEVEDFGADAIISQLLLLDSQDQGKDIKLFINSPGARPAGERMCARRVCALVAGVWGLVWSGPTDRPAGRRGGWWGRLAGRLGPPDHS